MKDAARLIVYFLAIVILGAAFAPVLYWGAHLLIDRGIFPSLAKVDFESFFHRALLIAALALLWPLLRSMQVRGIRDLDLRPNKHWLRDCLGGFLLAAIPLLCCAAVVVAMHVYSMRANVKPFGILQVTGATIVTPIIEEWFFRGLILGVLLRSGRVWISILLTSALFSIIHFLKAPGETSSVVTWTSGFNSIAHAFSQFSDPMMVAASFTTLLLLGLILADSRVQTQSLWLPGGLHAGWIFSAGIFNKIARREISALPWLGKSLQVGLVPLAVALVTWGLVRLWINVRRRKI